MLREEILDQLKNDVYCRLLPSPLGGIGVFAIKDIPEGINPFNGCFDGDYISFDLEEFHELEPAVFKLVVDMCVLDEGKLWLPDNGIQKLDLSWCLNHSSTPNMNALEKGEEFITNRVIKAGEELLVDYNTYDHQEGEDFRR